MITVWYDKAGGERPWLVKDSLAGTIKRCARVIFHGPGNTLFREEGHAELPCGPRGVLIIDGKYDLEQAEPWQPNA